MVSLAGALDILHPSVDGKGFLVLRLDPARDTLRQFWRDRSGRPYGRFPRLAQALDSQGLRLEAAMNGGMFHEGGTPVGLYVEEGVELRPLNLDSGTGNFFLRPNGVLRIGADGIRLLPSEAATGLPLPRLGLQSGPLLLSGGRLHPALDSLSRSRYVRSAVGLRGDTLFLALSEGTVNLHTTARLFRDVLHCPDALYLDGSIAGIHVPALGRSDTGALGPLLGIVRRR